MTDSMSMSRRLRPWHTHYRHPFLHSFQASDDDYFARVNAARDLDHALRPRTQLNFAAARLAADDRPHNVRRPQRLNRVLRNDDRIRTRRRRETGLDEHAGSQQTVVIG